MSELCEVYEDGKKELRVGPYNPLIGKYKIELSKVMDEERINSLCKSLIANPSNEDPEMYKVFRTTRKVLNEKFKLVPGFIVKRKVCVKDKVKDLD